MDKDVKKFEINPDYYVIKAVNYEMDGDIIAALGSVKAALALSDDVYLRLKAAAYYELMDRYEQASNIYFRLLAEKGDIMHCYYALSDNMFSIGEEAAGVHYLEKYTRLAQSDESREEAAALLRTHMEDLRWNEFRAVPSWAAAPESGLLPEIRTLVDADRFEDAAELSANVPEEAMDYVYAKNSEAGCRECLEQFSEAEICYGQVLRKEPQNTQALCGMARAEHRNGAAAGVGEYLTRIRELGDVPPAEMRRICFTFTECCASSEALEYLRNYLTNQPFDAEVLHLAGVAAYNTAHYAESFHYFDRARTVDDRFYVEKYYRRIASAMRDGEKQEKLPQELEYLWQVPNAEAERRLKKLKSSLGRLTQNTCRDIWQDPEFPEILYWSLSLGDTELNYYVIRNLALYHCPERDAYFDGLLLDMTAESNIKRHIVYCQAAAGGRTKLAVVYDGILKEIRLYRNTEDLPLVFRAAYAISVSTLSAVSNKFERALSRSLASGVARYRQSGKEFKKPNALSAALTYGSKLGGNLSDVKYLAELFSCRCDTLQNYIKVLGY